MPKEKDNTMSSLIRPAATLLAVFTLITGLAYPAAVTGVAAVLFPNQAEGSLVQADGQVLGSALIGQPFSGAAYFWSRPSATGPVAYNAAASTGSNAGPSNPALHDAVKGRIDALRAANPKAPTAIPVDLVTTSGSGLDPHISPAAAYYQVPRVAAARGMTDAAVRALIESHVESRTFGILGEPRVNVLLLNLALDQAAHGGR